MRNIKPLENSVIPSSASLSHEKVFSFILLSAGMLFILAWRGAGYFDDTVQYITMHIRREPVYPLYLAFFRFFFGSSDQPGVTGQAGLIAGTSQWKLFGVDFYLGIAAIVQVLMNACVMVVTADRICRLLQRRRHFFLLSILLQLFTQLMTMAASENHLFLAGSLLTESLSVPLFSLFFTECLAVMIAGRRNVCLPSSPEEPPASAFGKNRDKKSIVQPAARALLLAFLLTLIRSQFVGMIPLWALVTAAAVCRSAKSAARSGMPSSCAVGHESSHASLHHSSCSVSRSLFLRVLVILAAAGVALAGRETATCAYFDMLYGTWSDHSNANNVAMAYVLYASNREDSSLITDTKTRSYFLQMYDQAEAEGMNYSFTRGKSLEEKDALLENSYDPLKFDVIEDIIFNDVHETLHSDYPAINQVENRYTGEMIRSLLPAVWRQWLADYGILVLWGLFRSIGAAHRYLNIAEAGLYMLAVALLLRCCRLDHCCSARHTLKECGQKQSSPEQSEQEGCGRMQRSLNPEICFMTLALLSIAANVLVTAIVSPCLGRYMIYTFPMFWTAMAALIQAAGIREGVRRHYE